MQYNENILHWITTILSGMMTVVVIAITVVLIYKICVSKRRKKWVVITGIAAIIAFTFDATLIFVASVISLITNDNASTSMAMGVAFVGLIMYMISQTIMVLTFTVRIDKTFEGTDLAYSKCVLRSLYIASTMLIILGFSVLSCLVFGLWDLLSIGGIVWVLVYFAASISLVALFGRKIEELMIIRYKSEKENSSQSPRSVVNSNSSTISKTDVQQNNVQDDKVVKNMMHSKLFVLVIKHGLLVPFAITSSVICCVMDIVSISIMGNDEFHAAAAFWFVLDAFISSWCIFLLFGVNHEIYNKLCYPIHQSCEKCELWKLKRSNKLQTETQETEKVPQ